ETSKSDLLHRLSDLEAEVRYQEFAEQPGEEFSYNPGRIPVLLSAPHGTVHTRLDKPKQEDEYTSGFVRLIAELADTHVIFALYRSQTDPNWYPDTPYKQALREVVEREAIRFVLDIHGVAEHRKFGIALGTLHGKSCPKHRKNIVRHLEKFGFSQKADEILRRLDLDRAFTAEGIEGQETITRYIWESLVVPAAQFELHPSLRIVERRPEATEPQPFQGVPELIEVTINAFTSLINELAVSSP
ncbi:MAG: hypothetical protein GTO24_11760, partial [candidate division Zixibacteria bacterium]|nr:hypothetical protein [candidate division Zixibacteria bacterium]